MKYIKSHWWYRDSTNEWVWEWTVDIPVTFHGCYRYPGKYKFSAFFCYILFCRIMWKEYFYKRLNPYYRYLRKLKRKLIKRQS